MLCWRLGEIADAKEVQEMEEEVDRHLKLPGKEKEALGEAIFRKLAVFAAETLGRKAR